MRLPSNAAILNAATYELYTNGRLLAPRAPPDEIKYQYISKTDQFKRYMLAVRYHNLGPERPHLTKRISPGNCIRKSQHSMFTRPKDILKLKKLRNG
jgi:hypothetical protein